MQQVTTLHSVLESSHEGASQACIKLLHQACCMISHAVQRTDEAGQAAGVKQQVSDCFTMLYK